MKELWRRLQRLEEQMFRTTDRDNRRAALSDEACVRGLRQLLARMQVSDPYPHLEGSAYLGQIRAATEKMNRGLQDPGGAWETQLR